jgi:hypothetical protein
MRVTGWVEVTDICWKRGVVSVAGWHASNVKHDACCMAYEAYTGLACCWHLNVLQEGAAVAVHPRVF